MVETKEDRLKRLIRDNKDTLKKLIDKKIELERSILRIEKEIFDKEEELKELKDTF